MRVCREPSIAAEDGDAALPHGSSEEAPAEEQTESMRLSESLRAAFETLTPLCRGVFVLRKIYRLSHSEIAEVFGLSPRQIENYVAEGMVQCRSRLRKLGALEASDPGEQGGIP